SSGTAFTEPQARLLGRYSKNVIVNFDPDAAGAAAAERSLALLVSEDFRIKVLTLESGFDPDLYIRRQGKPAYAAALKSAPDYFDYLIARAQAQFRVNTADGKVQAVNFLLPHLQRVNNNIKRDELSGEMAQKLGIDSALLRRELKHAVSTRAATMKPAAAPIVSESEKIMLRALTSPDAELHARARAALAAENLHQGLETENILLALLDDGQHDDMSRHDISSLPLADSDRALLAGILMNENEELTPALVDGALNALRRQQLERRQRALKSQIAEAERHHDQASLARLMQEKINVDRALAG